MTLAERMREVMKHTGWSQAELARQAKVERSAVNQWLDGSVKTLKSDTGFTLEKASGFSARWITQGEGMKFAQKSFTLIEGKPRPEIDLELLRDAIAGVDIYLKERRQIAPPDRKAALVALVYEHSLSTGKVEPSAVSRILSLVP